MEGQIRKVMTSTLLSESKKRNIELKDLRVKMALSKDESSTECFVMNKTTEVSELGWQSILGFALMTFKMIVVNKITDSLKRISGECGIDKKNINARIYSIDQNGTPNIYIYDGGKPIKQIELSEII
jgi:hypothetical protein